MKYIVVETTPGHEDIHLFSSGLKHVDMAVRITGRPPHLLKEVVVSAGEIFYEAYKDEPTIMYCTGESVSLKVKSRGVVDTDLLIATLNAR